MTVAALGLVASLVAPAWADTSGPRYFSRGGQNFPVASFSEAVSKCAIEIQPNAVVAGDLTCMRKKGFHLYYGLPSHKGVAEIVAYANGGKGPPIEKRQVLPNRLARFGCIPRGNGDAPLCGDMTW
jgi:hypothetical protein